MRSLSLLTPTKVLVARTLCSDWLGQTVGWWFGDLVPSRGLKVRTSNSAVSPSTKAALFFGFYESAELRFVQRYFTGEWDTVELGSSIGVVSAELGRRMRPDRRLICLEANPTLLPVIEENLRINAPSAQAKIHHAALGEDGAQCTLEIGPTNVDGRVAVVKPAADIPSVSVTSISLSSLLARESLKDYAMVCDIEGAERYFIEGDAGALQGCRQLIVELHSWPERPSAIDELRDVLVNRHEFIQVDRHGPVCVFRRGQVS